VDVTLLGINVTIWNFGLKFVVAIAAGVWAIFLLRRLRKRDQANADIYKTQVDTEKTKADIENSHAKLQMEREEHQLKIRRQVSVSVDIQVAISAASEGYILITTVAITNHGNEATRITWRDEPPPFTVRFVTFDNRWQTAAWHFPGFSGHVN